MWRTHVHFPHRPRIPLRDIAIEHFSITKHYPPFVQQIFQNEGWNNIEIKLKKTNKKFAGYKNPTKKTTNHLLLTLVHGLHRPRVPLGNVAIEYSSLHKH